MIGVSHIPLYSATTLWRDLIKNVRAPNVTLLDVVKSLVSTSYKVVNSLDIAHFIMLSPVVSELELRQLWIGVPSVAI